MSTENHHFSNFGRSPVPHNLCKDKGPGLIWLWRRRFLKVFTIYGHGSHFDQWTKFPSGSVKICPISQWKLLFIKIITPRLAFTPFFALKTRLCPTLLLHMNTCFCQYAHLVSMLYCIFLNECTGISLFFFAYF